MDKAEPKKIEIQLGPFMRPGSFRKEIYCQLDPIELFLTNLSEFPNLAAFLKNNIDLIERGPQIFNDCVTNAKTITLSQKWTINDFANVMKFSKPGDVLRGQVFKNDAVPEVCWQMSLYPNGKRAENANNVTLFLKMSPRLGLPEAQVKAEYRFYFLNDQGERVFSNVNVAEFHAKPPKGGHSWGIRNIPMDKIMKSIRKDKSLLILCEVQLMSEVSKLAKPLGDGCEKRQRKTVKKLPGTPDDLPDDFEKVTLDDLPAFDEEFDAELVN